MAARQRKKREPAPGPSKAWLDSYADAMTLLLAFFVLLFAMSSLDVEKYRAFFEGVRGEFQPQAEGDIDGDNEERLIDEDLELTEPPVNLGPGMPPPAPSAGGEGEDPSEPVGSPENDQTDTTVEDDFFLVTQRTAEDLARKLDEALRVRLDPSDYSVTLEARGVVVRLADNVLFASGKADLEPAAQDVVTIVAEVLDVNVDNLVEVEGHTDSRPTSTAKFPTNWELSTARATNVLRHMLDSTSIDPTRLAAVGRADTVPRATNDTSEGQSLNRRTEIIVLFPGVDLADLSAALPDAPIDVETVRVDP